MQYGECQRSRRSAVERVGGRRPPLALHQALRRPRRYACFIMSLLLDILTWLGLAAAGLAVAGLLLVGVLAWLLNLPTDDDEPEHRAGRC